MKWNKMVGYMRKNEGFSYKKGGNGSHISIAILFPIQGCYVMIDAMKSRFGIAGSETMYGA
ncbi:hypothetical protein B5E43_14375 [Flavonifractor sp. An100]|nr:hypothetical protein B5E43_14375 [Flavonifractor sp. An100]